MRFIHSQEKGGGFRPTFACSFVFALDKAHVLGPNTAHVPRLSKADALAVNTAHPNKAKTFGIVRFHGKQVTYFTLLQHKNVVFSSCTASMLDASILHR